MPRKRVKKEPKQTELQIRKKIMDKIVQGIIKEYNFDEFVDCDAFDETDQYMALLSDGDLQEIATKVCSIAIPAMHRNIITECKEIRANYEGN